MERENLLSRVLIPVLLTASLVLSGCKKDSNSDEMLFGFGLGLLAASGSSDTGTSDPCDNFEGILCSSFEDGTLEEWSKIGAKFDSVTVDTTTGANGTSSSMKIDNSTVAGDGWNGAVGVDFASGVKPSYISYYAKYSADTSDTGAPAYAATFIGHDDIDTSISKGSMYIELYTYNPTGIISINEDDITVGSTVKGTWYHIEFKNIDWITQTYDLYLDGTVLDTGVPMFDFGPVVNIKKITFGNSGTGQTIWIDEFTMY